MQKSSVVLAIVCTLAFFIHVTYGVTFYSYVKGWNGGCKTDNYEYYEVYGCYRSTRTTNQTLYPYRTLKCSTAGQVLSVECPTRTCDTGCITVALNLFDNACNVTQYFMYSCTDPVDVATPTTKNTPQFLVRFFCGFTTLEFFHMEKKLCSSTVFNTFHNFS